MQGSNILWLDNDPAQLDGVRAALRVRGHTVTECRFVSEAEQALKANRYDLVILDVMIPISDQEVDDYPFDLIDDTLSTGLRFYQRMREHLVKAKTPVLVVTVRIDNTIAKAFRPAGLPERCFVTRYDVRDTKKFVARVIDSVQGGCSDPST